MVADEEHGPGGEPAATGARAVYAVYQGLRAAIVEGRLAPGTTLVEGALAKQFAVSRSPIREALGQLAYEGLIERRGRAMQVRIVRGEEIQHLYDVRSALESTAAQAAAYRRSDLDLARLQRIVDGMRAPDARSVEARRRLAHRFRLAVWRASHNKIMFETLEALDLRVAGLSAATLHDRAQWRTVVRECGEIVEAIRAHDAERAAAIVRQQMIAARDFRLEVVG